MKKKKVISNKIERKLGFANGWSVEEERYKSLCDEVAEDILKYITRKTKTSIIKDISEFNEERYGHCKDSCESQEYDAINNLIKELNSENKPKTK